MSLTGISASTGTNAGTSASIWTITDTVGSQNCHLHTALGAISPTKLVALNPFCDPNSMFLADNGEAPMFLCITIRSIAGFVPRTASTSCARIAHLGIWVDAAWCGGPITGILEDVAGFRTRRVGGRVGGRRIVYNSGNVSVAASGNRTIMTNELN